MGRMRVGIEEAERYGRRRRSSILFLVVLGGRLRRGGELALQVTPPTRERDSERRCNKTKKRKTRIPEGEPTGERVPPKKRRAFHTFHRDGWLRDLRPGLGTERAKSSGPRGPIRRLSHRSSSILFLSLHSQLRHSQLRQRALQRYNVQPSNRPITPHTFPHTSHDH